MPRNGSGVYSLPGGSTITNGDTSDASDLNTPFADLVSDANAARPIVAGGTGATSASAARTALGLAIGTDVQAEDAGLTSIAGLTTAADKMIYTTASDTYAVADLTAAGRALLDDADATAQRTTLGLGTAATVDVIDEDSFATDSATRPPSQQSTKAYVDAQTATVTPIGEGQTWQDVSGSRVAGTSYQNTTGRPIQISATVTRTNNSDFFWQVSDDNATWLNAARITGSAGANPAPSFQIIIPDTWYYRTSTGTDMTVTCWLELR